MNRATFVARLIGDVETTTVSYDWKTSRGRIVAGQGTPTIIFYSVEDDAGQNVEVTVSIRGLPGTCRVSTSDVIGVAAFPIGEPVDELGKIGPQKTHLWDWLSRLDSYFAAIHNNPGYEGLIVVEFSAEDAAEHKVQHIKRILDHIALRKFDRQRFTFAIGEHGYSEKTTLWTMHPKALMPKSARGYRIIGAEELRQERLSAVSLRSAVAKRFPSTDNGPVNLWLEIDTSKSEQSASEFAEFFDDLENNPDQEGIIEISDKRSLIQDTQVRLVRMIEEEIARRKFDRSRISYYPKIGDNQKIRIILIPPGASYENVGIDRSKLIKAEEFSVKARQIIKD